MIDLAIRELNNPQEKCFLLCASDSKKEYVILFTETMNYNEIKDSLNKFINHFNKNFNNDE